MRWSRWLRHRPDHTAVLDVCDPEPPAQDCPLLTLPNVVMPPHIAGSMGPEIRRLGRYMVEELHRYVAGEPDHIRAENIYYEESDH